MTDRHVMRAEIAAMQAAVRSGEISESEGHARFAAIWNAAAPPQLYYWREGDPVSTEVHRECGALVADREAHDAWHRTLEGRAPFRA